MNTVAGKSTAVVPETMRAAQMHRRGGPDLMRLERVRRPTPGSRDALVEVHAAAITPTELEWVPTWTARDGSDRTPIVPAHEVSGVVVGLGPESEGLEVGEAVFGLTDFYRDGAAAEYVAVAAADLAHKPLEVPHFQAAALPLSGLTAWEGLVQYGRLKAGERVLVHGAAGGVGSFVVQLARHFGATVHATASGQDLDFVRGIGAELAIDYRAERFEQMTSDVDLIFDTIGGETLERSWQVLGERGRLVTIAPAARDVGSHDRRGTFFVVEPNRDALAELGVLAAAGEISIIIDRVFSLADAPKAFAHGLGSHTRGKVVVAVRA